MSQAMNQKMASKKNKNTKKNNNRTPLTKSTTKGSHRPANLPVVEDEEQEEIITFGDKLLKAISPHITTIAFALIAGFLGFAVIAFLMRSSSGKKAICLLYTSPSPRDRG